MSPETTDSLSDRGHSMEEEFFRREDAKLIEKLRASKRADEARAALSRATGLTDPAVLDRLAAQEIDAATAAALAVLPFVEVAWADGSIDAKERAALVDLARAQGFAPGSPESALLEAWLAERPAPRFFAAWSNLVQGLCSSLDARAVDTMRTTLLERARAVANASGGVFGIGKVSSAESALLDKLTKAFGARR